MTQTPLTRTMQPIIEAVGFEAAQALVKTYGGTRAYVALAPRPVDDLVLCIGLGNARALAAAIGPGPLEVPKCLSTGELSSTDDNLAASTRWRLN